jgi:hypothetical protein
MDAAAVGRPGLHPDADVQRVADRFVVSTPYTTLKGWPGRTQAIFIGVVLMVVVSLVLGGAWINSR